MILFLDTETAGLPKDYKAPASDVDNWPRLVQVGWIAVYESGKKLEYENIIRPEGFEIPEMASSVHGITTEKAMSDGVGIQVVLSELLYQIGNADKIVMHNANFDTKVLGAEYIRWIKRNPFDNKVIVDTMELSKEFVGIPGKYGGYKWPKLHELYRALFAEEMGEAHTALQDIRNTEKCYYELVERGIIK